MQKRPMPSDGVIGESGASSSTSRKRKRRAIDAETPMEKLPAEILQQIFSYSANIDLPIVSRQLAFKLSQSQHLEHHLTSRLLRPVLGHPTTNPTASALTAATRLLNSRFVTWDFFAQWLRNQPEASAAEDASPSDASEVDLGRLWASMGPAPNLLLPKKLLLPPFTTEKIQFLRVLAQNIQDVAALDASYGAVAYEGLVAAVRAGQPEVVSIFLSMGIEGDTELLRIAVAEAGCNKRIVEMLVSQSTRSLDSSQQTGRRTASESVDLLDPVVWTWTEKASGVGDGKDEWLVSLLKNAQQRTKERGL